MRDTQRGNAVEAFKTNPEIYVMVNTRSGGEGLNLICASRVIIV
jgi:SNF2 family DNA or RNA helicase